MLAGARDSHVPAALRVIIGTGIRVTAEFLNYLEDQLLVGGYQFGIYSETQRATYHTHLKYQAFRHTTEMT